MWKIEIDSLAELEILAAFEWYEKENSVVARQFLDILDAALETLKFHPHFQRRYKQTHCFPLRKFPFMLHYQILEKENLVYVTGCIHTSLHPDKNWR